MMTNRRNNVYKVDWNRLHWYIKMQSYLEWRPLMKYIKEVVWINYSTLFPIKRNNSMYSKTKRILDSLYGWDPLYDRLYKWIDRPKPNKTKKV